MTSTSVTLSWLPPETPNGIIRHYNIFLDEQDKGLNRTVVAHSTTNVIVGGLHPYYTYHLSVKAVTIVSGEPSKMLIFKTLQDGMWCKPLLYVYM